MTPEASASDAPAATESLPAGEFAATAMLRIEGPMTFDRAIELRDAVLVALDRQPALIELDLSVVTELDSAGVQILLLAKLTAAARNKALRLAGQSSAVLRTLELLHLSAHFGAPSFVLFDEAFP